MKIFIIIIIIIIINTCCFDEPHDAFEVHFSYIFLMKTKHVSDETSSIISCLMRSKMKLCNKQYNKVRR